MSGFDETYYERGVRSGVSGYTNYHWRPEYVLPFVNAMISKFHPYRVLDIGCAKGFTVKGFRLLGIHAYGYDISKYAIDNADPDVKAYVSTKFPEEPFDLIIAKDTLEHVPKSALITLLSKIFDIIARESTFVVIVPLGDNGLFRIREYELDKTHVIKEDEVWWIKQFNAAGFNCKEFYYIMDGVKDNWKQFPTGNGIFVLKSK